jgi:aspartyl/asparaginyl beta-hydroxylase (cupin superfamily)
LQAHWEEIREEGQNLLRAGEIKRSNQYDDVGFNSFFKSGWKRFYLKWYGESHPSAMKLCPRTTELVQSIGSIKAAMFAELPPGSKLVRHRDPYAGSYRYHLGLDTPNDAPVATSTLTVRTTTGATVRRWCSMRRSSITPKTPRTRTASSCSATSSVR